MKKSLSDYLGHQASVMLNDSPFKNWRVDRSLEEDLKPPLIHYVFPRRGLELRCDDDEKVSVIFLRSEENDSFTDDFIAPYLYWNRLQVLKHFGSPSKSGEKSSHPILGDYGAWDRFDMQGYAIRFEYKMDSQSVKKVTFMRNDVIP